MNLFQTENSSGVVSYINPDYIIDIRDNYTINKTRNGSKINVQGAMVSTFYDTRTPDEIAGIIKELNTK
jgi:hypothetical protein